MPIMSAENIAASLMPLGNAGKWPEVPPGITIFCDLDGPLVDVSKRYYKTYQLAISETQAYLQRRGQALQLTPLNAAQFWQMKRERVPDADIAFCSGLRHDQIELFLASVQDIVNQPLLLREDRLQPDVSPSLACLQQYDIPLSVITLRWQEQAQQLLQQFQIDHYFKQICGAADGSGAYDNFVEGKQALLSDLVRPMSMDARRNAWMIGDTEADMLAGKALGLSTIALSCGIRSQAYLQRLEPTTVQPDLKTAVHYLLTHTVHRKHPSS
jgi:phosphoglycolate phosphatase